MMKPEAADFMDLFTHWLGRWYPDLMDKVSMADVSEIWGDIEELLEEAETREPIRSQIRRSSSPQQQPS